MPRQPRGKRIGSNDHDFSVVSKNSNGDGSVYFEPGRSEKAGRVRGKRCRVSTRAASQRTAGDAPSTTAGYVRRLGHRPSDTARTAAALLDPSLD